MAVRIFLFLCLLAGGCWSAQVCEDLNQPMQSANSIDSFSWSTKWSVVGFERSAMTDITKITKQISCTATPDKYQSQRFMCQVTDWNSDMKRDRSWAMCQDGYFLNGMERGQGTGLDSIKRALCCKPVNHPNTRGSCQYIDVIGQTSMRCPANHFVVGMKHGDCNQLRCITNLKCCQMTAETAVEQTSSLEDAKAWVMDETMERLALLAHYMGYGWCSGCYSGLVGRDFKRVGDSWKANKEGTCTGLKGTQRLNINYGDFKFVDVAMEYGEPVIEELPPHLYLDGVERNDDASQSKVSVFKDVASIRTVTHTTTGTTRMSHNADISVGYKSPVAAGQATFSFGYKTATTTKDANGKQDKEVFRLTTNKTLPAYSSAEWRIMMIKKRITVPYTATIKVHFSVEFDGFLRWGQGYYGPDPNFHMDHRGKKSRPTFQYRFGDSDLSFSKALELQSRENRGPWMWNDAKQWYNHMQTSLIDQLTNDNYYTFPLTGQFEDSFGMRADVEWSEVVDESDKLHRDSAGAKKVGKNDKDEEKYKFPYEPQKEPPKAPTPDPPKPNIKVPKSQPEIPRVVVTPSDI